MLGAFPELDARLSWNVPQLQRDGKYVLGLSAAKKHLSVSPWSTDVIEDFRPRLEQRFTVTKNLFQVPVDWEIDEALLTDLVRARLAELEQLSDADGRSISSITLPSGSRRYTTTTPANAPLPLISTGRVEITSTPAARSRPYSSRSPVTSSAMCAVPACV